MQKDELYSLLNHLAVEQSKVVLSRQNINIGKECQLQMKQGQLYNACKCVSSAIRTHTLSMLLTAKTAPHLVKLWPLALRSLQRP